MSLQTFLTQMDRLVAGGVPLRGAEWIVFGGICFTALGFIVAVQSR